jgi:hypothetical protein
VRRLPGVLFYGIRAFRLGLRCSPATRQVAMNLNLPIIDRRMISGVHGRREVNVHLAHVHVPSLSFTVHGPFSAVDLAARGQSHLALIGRTFLQHFRMVYEGRTGTVTLTND